MTTHKKLKIIDLDITHLSKDGFGIGSYLDAQENPHSVEVPFTIPGDRAQALLLKKRSGVYKSLLEGIITPSSERIEPRCAHFAMCGGCRWQMLPYTKQLEIKTERVREYFKSLLVKGVIFHPIIPCDPPWNYRNKMEFSFTQSVQGEKYLGLMMQGSRGKAFQLTECHLVNPWFAELVKGVKLWWESSGLDAFFPPSDKGSLRTLTVREGLRTGDRMVYMTVSGNADYALNKEQINSWLRVVRECAEPHDPNQKLSIFIRIHQQIKGVKTNFYELHLYGPAYIREELTIQTSETVLRSLTFNISPTAFFQPNTFQAEKLYSRALQMAKIPEKGVVYDLYCGTGTLGICASQYASQVVGIELVPEAALDAQENAKTNHVDNVKIYHGDVAKILLEKKESLPKPDVVMVDPPRMGLDPKALEQIVSLSAPKVVYISCNPLTQVRDAELLVQAGYRLESIQPVDQFPHTIHIENIAVFTKQ
jgi:23S rRNA (uracil1939-C5)-methyltransferase